MAFPKKSPLTVELILKWADSHYERTGDWPNARRAERVMEAPEENWGKIESALRNGFRGLPAGLSVARLLSGYRGRRNRADLPVYHLQEILGWADAYRQRTGTWPQKFSGAIPESPGESWLAVEGALYYGFRGLPKGSSIARLLAEHRGVRNFMDLPPLSLEYILAWADAFHQRTGDWPHLTSGAIPEAPGETWLTVQNALAAGCRGLPAGLSLSRMLVQYRAVRRSGSLPPLSESLILEWADATFQRTGKWPSRASGVIDEAPGDTWQNIDEAIRRGRRGLVEGGSLLELLERERGIRNRLALPDLRVDQILEWADAYHHRSGRWPNRQSGSIPEAPGENWSTVGSALVLCKRGLPGGLSLARMLAEHRGVRNKKGLPALTEETILAWADAHFRRTGDWPHRSSGPIPEADGESWEAVYNSLHLGRRGLPGGASLSRLLAARRGARGPGPLPAFSESLILEWADAHFRRTGKWPGANSGAVEEAPDETWRNISRALYSGRRGLRGGVSLAGLLERERGVRNPKALPDLDVDRILEWADAYYLRCGCWPTRISGAVPEVPGEKWSTVDYALAHGNRGLPKGLSLAGLIRERAQGIQLASDTPG